MGLISQCRLQRGRPYCCGVRSQLHSPPQARGYKFQPPENARRILKIINPLQGIMIDSLKSCFKLESVRRVSFNSTLEAVRPANISSGPVRAIRPLEIITPLPGTRYPYHEHTDLRVLNSLHAFTRFKDNSIFSYTRRPAGPPVTKFLIHTVGLKLAHSRRLQLDRYVCEFKLSGLSSWHQTCCTRKCPRKCPHGRVARAAHICAGALMLLRPPLR